MGSTRLPGKVLQELAGIPALEILLTRLNRSTLINEICVATSHNEENNPLCALVSELGFNFIRGSESDVLDRFVIAANSTSADIVIRITGDCPLVDPVLVDDMIKHYINHKLTYLSNTNPPTFPDGLDVEIFSMDLLLNAATKAQDKFDREHVTPYIRRNLDTAVNFLSEIDFSKVRLTLDDKKDLHLLDQIFQHFAPNLHFSYTKVLRLIHDNIALRNINETTERNKGARMSNNQKRYERAKNVIAGGTSLLSKRPEMLLPDYWPTYFKKTSGVKVWDLENNEYIDMGLMGVGTNTLGYSHPDVDNAVRSVIDQGNLSSLNCFEEVELAEKLVEMNPWASKVRYARSGGEANAIAVRIARTAARSTNIAVCGYHGWHDWYLAANLGDTQGLDGHLMPGLQPDGVPRDLGGSVFTFDYNNIEQLQDLIIRRNIGVIKMEVMRNSLPKNNFLEQVRKIADDNNIILIFDECSSGFRETFGGLFNKYQVIPDIAVFGKTLGNGYAITAVVGKEEVMQCAQRTFISSTFWTERIGPAAALKSLEIMEREESWSRITKIGKQYREQLDQMSHDIGLYVEITGLPALTAYSVTETCKMEAKTYITQELLKKGILGTTTFYPSIMHKEEHLDNFFTALKPILQTIKQTKESKENYNELLDGPVCHSGFKRLN